MNTNTPNQSRRSSSASASKTRVKVCVRVRPLIAREKDAEQSPLDVLEEQNAIRVGAANGPLLAFDHVYGPKYPTIHVYNQVLKDMVYSVCDGFDVTTFAYGMTASGKTHTMMGSDSEYGVVRLAMHDIFDYIQSNQDNRTYLMRVSYLEIYNEKVFDSLSVDCRPVNMFNDKKGNITFDHLNEEIVRNVDEVMMIIKRGESFRSVAKTVLNERSSRSHTIFRLILERKDQIPVNTSSTKQVVKVGCLNIVDLAGSENASQQVSDDRRREGNNINLSLMFLKEVILKLSRGEKVQSLRNSKLTRLLGNSLGGDANVAIICNISPANRDFEQTKKTLEFGNCARKIVINPISHSDCDNALILKYQSELEQMQSELELLREQLKNSTEPQQTQTDVEELEKVVKELSSVMVSNDSLQKRLANVEQEKLEREQQLQDLEKERFNLQELLKQEEQEKKKKEVESLSKDKELLSLKQETEQLRERLMKVRTLNENSEKIFKEKEQKLSEMQSRNRNLLLKFREEEKARIEMEKKVVLHSKQLEEMNKNHADLTSQFKKEQTLRSEVEKRVEQQNREMFFVKNALNLETKQKKLIESELNSWNEDLPIIYKMLQEDYQASLKQFEEEKTYLNTQLAQLHQVIADKEVKIEHVSNKSVLDGYTKYIKDLEEKNERAKQRLQHATSEINSIKKELVQVKQENSQLKQENYQLKQEKQTARNEAAQYKQALDLVVKKRNAVSAPATPPPQDSSQWIECLSDSGRVYYYNKRTGISQWNRPN